MLFLIIKMFVYLLVAAAAGGGAGWLIRNLQAQKSEENASRAVHDAKSKVPQLESLLRGRDDQIKKLKEEVRDLRVEASSSDQSRSDLEQKLREQEREAKRWQQSAQSRQSNTLDGLELDGEGDDHSNLIAELSQEIDRLKAALESQEQAAEAAAPQVDDGLAEQLAEAEEALSEAQADLKREQVKVTELERERELQNKSLQVLHQQLELERSKTAAANF